MIDPQVYKQTHQAGHIDVDVAAAYMTYDAVWSHS